MGGIGVENGEAVKALDAVKERLDTATGSSCSTRPTPTTTSNSARSRRIRPATRRTRASSATTIPWIIIAETVVGRGDRAFEYWKKIAPAYREEISEIHRLEPYVYAQMIAGKDAVRHGEAKNSWLTGTAAWNFVAVSQYLLGIRPDYDGLIIDPCIGPEIPEFTVTADIPRGRLHHQRPQRRRQGRHGDRRRGSGSRATSCRLLRREPACGLTWWSEAVRLVSLLPSATEIVYALGLGDQLVGVTFECDEPPAARQEKAVVVGGRDTTGMTPGDIDTYVREHLAAGGDLYTLHADALAGLEPDLILTQDLCRVCALPSDHVEQALAHLGCRADVLTLDPYRLDEVLDTILAVGARTGVSGRADDLVAQLRDRLAAVAAVVAGRPRPRVAVVEWVDPPFVAGHWVPDLVTAAGGEAVAARPGRRSVQTGWDDFVDAAPDIVLVSPCGFHLDGAADQARAVAQRLPGAGDLGRRRRRLRGASRPAAGRRCRDHRGDPASGSDATAESVGRPSNPLMRGLGQGHRREAA